MLDVIRADDVRAATPYFPPGELFTAKRHSISDYCHETGPAGRPLGGRPSAARQIVCIIKYVASGPDNDERRPP